MNELKIILLCSTRFALPVLRELAFFNMLAVVAIPRFSDELIENVEMVLAETGIPIIKLNKETFAVQLQEAIEANHVKLGLVMTFPYKIPSSVYDLPVNGFFNIHPGPLPQYRGADPVFHQLKNQEKQAGVSVHKLDEGIDAGPVVISEMMRIEPSDTYGLLTTRLSNLAAKLTGILIKLVSFNISIPSRPQDETKARYYKKQQAKDIVIDWQTMDADSIIALINACNPWNKGAVTKINQQIIRLIHAEKLPGETADYKDPGHILDIEDNGITISTIRNGAIKVIIIYADEGFLMAKNLKKLGVVPGNRFEMI